MLDREFGALSLSGLRAAVLDCASAAGLPDDRAIDVMLALHELAANAVRHGSGRGRLRIDVRAGALRCQVSDDGTSGAGAGSPEPPGTGQGQPGRTPGAGPGPDSVAPGNGLDTAAAGGPATGSFRSVQDWPVQHGHGLWLVRRTADLVQATAGPGGTVVDVSFNLPAG